MSLPPPTIPDIDPKYLQVEYKEDSTSKLAAIAGKLTKYFLFAWEFERHRIFSNKLRDDIDGIKRPEKIILLSEIADAGYYTFQPGDEKLFLIVNSNNAFGATYSFTIIDDNFPADAEFIVFFYNTSASSNIVYSNANPIYGQTVHSPNGNIARIRRVSNLAGANNKWIITYQISNPS